MALDHQIHRSRCLLIFFLTVTWRLGAYLIQGTLDLQLPLTAFRHSPDTNFCAVLSQGVISANTVE